MTLIHGLDVIVAKEQDMQTVWCVGAKVEWSVAQPKLVQFAGVAVIMVKKMYLTQDMWLVVSVMALADIVHGVMYVTDLVEL